MGTWGPGNFQSDGALDCVGDLCADLVAQVERILATPGDADADQRGESHLVPSVEILSVLCDRCGGTPPELERVVDWRERYLAIYDRTMPGLDPTGDFTRERRAVVADTFAKLETQSRRFWQV